MKCPKCQHENPDDSMFCGKCANELEVASKAPIGATETVESSIEELTTGSKFAERYQVIEELGKGGMGSVYKVHDTQLNEKVALKLIKPEIASDKKVIARFSNELKLARRISHPGVGRMYELMDHRGTRFITMEYIPGEDLRSMIRMSGQLGIGTSISITKQICEGLTEAHRLGVVHRDLKPSNIMIDKTGRARIMDFGIARSIEAKRMTGAGIMIGTPEYMSPEQVEGKETDQRSDIYSLGIIIYEMLTGRVPFEGDTPFTVGVKHKSEDPEDPKKFNSRIPDDLSRIILRCLEKKPEDRFQNTGDVCAALTQIEQGIPTTEWEIAKKKTQTSKEITVTFQKRWAVFAVPVVVVLAAALAFFLLKKEKVAPASDKLRLVVLPFENKISAEEQNYVDGISGEIRNRLNFVEGLALISRDTAIQYEKSGKTARQIGEEDNVDYVLKGAVYGEKEEGVLARVIIHPYLIRTADDTELPIAPFSQNLDDFSEVWSEIATEVTRQLAIVLEPTEIAALEAKLTDNADAYKAYLSGLGYMDIRYEEESLRLAIQMFDLAVRLDPDFAYAYGNLSRSHALMYQHGFDRSEERKSLAKAAVDKMRDLKPELPETHLALGSYYYWCLKDYDRALEHLNVARQGLSLEFETLNMIAYILRRRNDFVGSIKLNNQSMNMDPQSWRIALEIGNTEIVLRNYERAEHFFSRSISLEPSQTRGYIMKALTFWLWTGDISKVVEAIESMPQKNDPALDFTYYLLWMGKQDYQAALNVLHESSSDNYLGFGGLSPKELLEGTAYAAMGKMDEARDSFDRARFKLESMAKGQPDDSRIHSSLGKVYAALGRKEDALREARLAMELYPISMDTFEGPGFVADYAEVLVRVGEYDKALEQIDYLLSIPCRAISVATLQNDPTWLPLHDHPRFQEILKKYSK